MHGLPANRKPKVSPTGVSVGDLLARGWWVLAALLVLGGGLWVYGDRATPLPVIDDGAVFTDNPAVRNPSVDWVTAAFYADTHRPIWRPLSTLSLRWNWQHQPGRRAPAIETNLLLLMASGFLFALLLRRLRLHPGLAIAGGLLMIVHSGLTDTVLRLAGRAELLAAVFVLGAANAYTYLSEPNRLPREVRPPVWVLVGMLFLFGLLSHEIALLLPVWLAGIEGWAWLRARRQGSRQAGGGPGTLRWMALLLIMAAVALGWNGFRTGVLKGWPHEMKMEPAPDYVAALESHERIELALALPAYYSEMIFGRHILPDHAHLVARPEGAAPIQIGSPRTFGVGRQPIMRVVSGIAVLAVAAVGILALSRRVPGAALGVWWYLTAVLVALPLFASNGHVATTRHMIWILPGVWLALLSGAQAWGRGAKGLAPKTLAIAILLLAVIGVAAAATRATAGNWKSQRDLMAYLERQAPRSPEVPLYKGLLALQQGDMDRGAAFMEKSLDRFPRNPRALLNLALLRIQLGDAGMGGRILHDASVVTDRIIPHSGVACRVYLSMGSFLIEQDLRDQALDAYRKAVQADSLSAQAHARLGFMETNLIPTIESGLAHIDRALELDQGRHTLGPLEDQLIDLKRRAIDYLQEEGLRRTSAGDSILFEEHHGTWE
jgi:tetratricopeptide (TPR) repeat protein